MKKRAKIKLIKSKNRAIYLARYLVYFVKLFVWKMKHKPKWKKTAKISAIATIYLVVSFASFLGIKKILSIPRAPKMKIAESNSPFIYTAKAKEFEVSLGDKKTNIPKIEFSISGNTITFTPASGREKINEPTMEGETLIFREVYPKVDYQYQTTPKGIKEEIIIKQPTIIKQFPFFLEFEGVIPKYIAENLAGGVFYDEENNYLFHFEKPFAYDSAGTRTEDVQLLVKRDIETKKYVAIIGIDPTWIDSPERVYPIYIDPTVVHDETSEFATGQFNRVKDTGSGSSPNLTTYYQELPADGHTVGLWHLDETSDNSCSGGEDACDLSGNGFHATDTGGTAIDTTNQVLGTAARSFDGTNKYLEVAHNNAFSFGAPGATYTLEAWIKTSANGAVLAKARPTAAVNIEYVLSVSSNVVSLFRWCEGCPNTGNTVTGTISVTDNNWHHIAFVNESASSHKIYVDGKLDVTNTSTWTFTDSNTQPLQIGKYHNYAYGQTYFTGLIDEVRISNIARNPEEMRMTAQKRPYSIYTSDSINLGSSVYSLDSLEWTELGVTRDKKI